MWSMGVSAYTELLLVPRTPWYLSSLPEVLPARLYAMPNLDCLDRPLLGPLWQVGSRMSIVSGRPVDW